MSRQFYMYNQQAIKGQPYVSWKPVTQKGITAGNIRPLTNKDYTNDTIYKPGLARPLKIYRKGTSTIEAGDEDRFVRSSIRNGEMVNAMQDRPGGYFIASDKHVNSCVCEGVPVSSSYYPNKNLSQTPEQRSASAGFCCNAEKNAKQRVLSANTNLPKKYYTSTKQYLQSKCQTYDQKIYHYKRGENELVGQCCVPGCNRVYYKPNNSAFATDGAVSSSAQILRTQVNTIEKAAYNTIRATGTRNKFIHKMFNEIPSRCCY